MQFQQDGPKVKKLQLFQIFARKLEKFRSTERSSCTSRGIDNFSLAQLHEPYSVESSRLAELKYAISAGQDAS